MRSDYEILMNPKIFSIGQQQSMLSKYYQFEDLAAGDPEEEFRDRSDSGVKRFTS
jgi:hypothetical protein